MIYFLQHFNFSFSLVWFQGLLQALSFFPVLCFQQYARRLYEPKIESWFHSSVFARLIFPGPSWTQDTVPLSLHLHTQHNFSCVTFVCIPPTASLILNSLAKCCVSSFFGLTEIYANVFSHYWITLFTTTTPLGLSTKTWNVWKYSLFLFLCVHRPRNI